MHVTPATQADNLAEERCMHTGAMMQGTLGALANPDARLARMLQLKLSRFFIKHP
jgi:hypothetical protein